MESVLLTVSGLVVAGLALLGTLVVVVRVPWHRFAVALEVFRAGLQRGLAPLRVGVRRRRDTSGA
ncbi:hypothetical protein [Pseudonocardia sp.]|uniref:hypothetical protein n=1 Tax=Pseudonocardia sp. TaxID=60912 RepID=UPI003D0DC95D